MFFFFFVVLAFYLPVSNLVKTDYGVNYPIRHGQVDNWDHMERFWENSIFKYLRCEPEDHHFLLVRSFFFT